MAPGRLQADRTGDVMDAETRVREHFAESIAVKQASAEILS
jgi:hypothetical protein